MNGKRELTLILIFLIVFSNYVPVRADPGFPVIEDVTPSTFASGTSHLVNYPAAVDAGDLLICVFGNDDNENVGFPNEGVDWHIIYEEDAGSQGPTLAVAWREADGAEDGGTFDVTTGTTEGACAYVFRITGAEDPDTSPPEVSAEGAGASVNPNSLSLSPTGGSKEYLWISVEANDDDDDTTGWPANMADNNVFEQVASATLGIATEESETDTFDPDQFTIAASESWDAVTIAVYPAAPVGTDYEREINQSISLAFNAYRPAWSLTRAISLSISGSFDAYRFGWTTSRVSDLGLTFSWDAFKQWTLLREITNSFTFVFNAYETLISAGPQTYLREISVSLSTSFSFLRQWTLLRGIANNFQFVFNAFGQFLIPIPGIQINFKVVDIAGIGISGVIVTFENETATIFRETTNATGQIPEQTITPQNLSLSATHRKYTEYEHGYEVEVPISWVITLPIKMSLVLFIFVVLSLITFIGMVIAENPIISVCSAAVSFICWGVTSLYYLFENYDYPGPALLFGLFATIALIYAIYSGWKMLNPYEMEKLEDV